MPGEKRSSNVPNVRTLVTVPSDTTDHKFSLIVTSVGDDLPDEGLRPLRNVLTTGHFRTFRRVPDEPNPNLAPTGGSVRDDAANADWRIG